MANTTYKQLAASVYDKIKDLDLGSLPEDVADEIVIGYISPACVEFQSATQDLSNRDDVNEEFLFKLNDDTYNLLVNYMVLQWLDANYLKTSVALKNRLTPSDFKSLNLPQHLSKIMELHTMLKKENDQLAINKSYMNSTLFDIVTNRKKVLS